MSKLRNRSSVGYEPINQSDLDIDSSDRPISKSVRSNATWIDTPKEAKIPFSTIATGLFLFVVGVAFAISSYSVYSRYDLTEAKPFIVIAFMTLLPGLYSLSIIVMIWLKVPGYHPNMLPTIQ